jgi:hypothetical protein
VIGDRAARHPTADDDDLGAVRKMYSHGRLLHRVPGKLSSLA